MILHDTSNDYFGIFQKAAAADDVGMDAVSINYDESIKQWHILVHIEASSKDRDVVQARWEKAIEERRRVAK